MSDFFFAAGKKIKKMKREAIRFEAHPPIWAIVVAGAVVWITMQALRAL